MLVQHMPDIIMQYLYQVACTMIWTNTIVQAKVLVNDFGRKKITKSPSILTCFLKDAPYSYNNIKRVNVYMSTFRDSLDSNMM